MGQGSGLPRWDRQSCLSRLTGTRAGPGRQHACPTSKAWLFWLDLPDFPRLLGSFFQRYVENKRVNWVRLALLLFRRDDIAACDGFLGHDCAGPVPPYLFRC